MHSINNGSNKRSIVSMAKTIHCFSLLSILFSFSTHSSCFMQPSISSHFPSISSGRFSQSSQTLPHLTANAQKEYTIDATITPSNNVFKLIACIKPSISLLLVLVPVFPYPVHYVHYRIHVP